MQRMRDHWRATFHALGGPCEILVATDDRQRAERACAAGAGEARRIEADYSRFREDSLLQRVNRADGRPVRLNPEFCHLIDFADRCHRLSGGLFDISCGSLQRAWRFGHGGGPPGRAELEALLRATGWHKVRWARPCLTMPADMRIDLGGIGKEYAVDRALSLATEAAGMPNVLVNFGGDLACAGARGGRRPWQVALERPPGASAPARTQPETAGRPIALARGGLATSGNTRRFVVSHGRRYGHLIDPRTGYPVPGAPLSVTVRAPSCLEAGMLGSIAMLHGAGAERFLRRQRVEHWCVR